MRTPDSLAPTTILGQSCFTFRTSFWPCLRHGSLASSLPLPSAHALACWGRCPQTPFFFTYTVPSGPTSSYTVPLLYNTLIPIPLLFTSLYTVSSLHTSLYLVSSLMSSYIVSSVHTSSYTVSSVYPSLYTIATAFHIISMVFTILVYTIFTALQEVLLCILHFVTLLPHPLHSKYP